MRAWMKDWRDANGKITQKQAAESLDMPETTFASYEQSHRTPSVDRAKEIADKMNSLSAIHVKWTYFFEDDVLIMSTDLAEGVS